MPVCEQCNNTFTPRRFKNSNRQKFCSRQCREDYHNATVIKAERDRQAANPLAPRSCKNCGKVFTPRFYMDRNVFCCRKCAVDYGVTIRPTKEHLEIHCEACHAVFRQSRKDQRFCCHTCKRTYERQAKSQKAKDRRDATTKTCPICSKQFTPAHTMRQIYCSRRCALLITSKIHTALFRCLKKAGTRKQNHTYDILGYTPADLLHHIQNHPNWDKVKRGEWHLDHIFPIKAFIDHGITDIKIICSLANLQPLSGKDNAKKNSKYDPAAFQQYIKQTT